MNGYAILFHKTCVHSCNTARIHNALHYWRLLQCNVFGIGIGGVSMRSKIIPSPTPTFKRTCFGVRTVHLLQKSLTQRDKSIHIIIKLTYDFSNSLTLTLYRIIGHINAPST
jgi:hypothetical protein